MSAVPPVPPAGDPLAIAIDHFLPAPPAAVFHALVDAGLYARWLGPEGSQTTVDAMDAVPGGRFAIRVRTPAGGEVPIEGVYLAVDPPDRLSHTWQVGGEGDVTTVTFELHPHGGGTRMLLTHTGFTDPLARAGSDGGWRDCLERLGQVTSSL